METFMHLTTGGLRHVSVRREQCRGEEYFEFTLESTEGEFTAFLTSEQLERIKSVIENALEDKKMEGLNLNIPTLLKGVRDENKSTHKILS